MLILTRLPHESIQIADDIVVTYFGHRQGQAVIGIEAPPSVDILRSELVGKRLSKALRRQGEKQRR